MKNDEPLVHLFGWIEFFLGRADIHEMKGAYGQRLRAGRPERRATAGPMTVSSGLVELASISLTTCN